MTEATSLLPAQFGLEFDGNVPASIDPPEMKQHRTLPSEVPFLFIITALAIQAITVLDKEYLVVVSDNIPARGYPVIAIGKLRKSSS